MDKVAALLPDKIEEAVKGTPVVMLTKVVDRRNIEAFLAIELTKLKTMVNVDERLNLQVHQIPEIAKTLVDHFKNENLADFTICFKRGAMGLYDSLLLRLDGSVIMHWMAKYLEEKYQVIETNLMKEKEDYYKKFDGVSDEFFEAWKNSLGDVPQSPKNNEQINAYERAKISYKPMTKEEFKERELHDLYIRQNYDPDGKKKECWMEESEWRELVNDKEI